MPAGRGATRCPWAARTSAWWPSSRHAIRGPVRPRVRTTTYAFTPVHPKKSIQPRHGIAALLNANAAASQHLRHPRPGASEEVDQPHSPTALVTAVTGSEQLASTSRQRWGELARWLLIQVAPGRDSSTGRPLGTGNCRPAAKQRRPACRSNPKPGVEIRTGGADVLGGAIGRAAAGETLGEEVVGESDCVGGVCDVRFDAAQPCPFRGRE